MKATQKILVIGNGMVGHKFLEAIATQPEAAHYEITAFCEEPRLA